MIDTDNNIPMSTGVLRANSLEYPFLIKKSDVNPDKRTPTNAAKKGNDANSPDLIKSSPLYFTKYVGIAFI